MVAPAVPEYVPPETPGLRVPRRCMRSAIVRPTWGREVHSVWRRRLTVCSLFRIHEEEDIYVAVDARSDSLQSLRELGPPDLVYLVKQPKANSTRQVFSCMISSASMIL